MIEIIDAGDGIALIDNSDWAIYVNETTHWRKLYECESSINIFPERLSDVQLSLIRLGYKPKSV